MFGFISVGLLTDLVGKGVYFYSVYLGFHMFNIVLVFIALVAFLVNPAESSSILQSIVYNGFLGWLVTVNFVLLFYVLPLYISSKLREKRAYWEIPMAAQTFAMFELLLYVVSNIFSPIFFEMFGFSNKYGFRVGMVIVPLIFLIIAIYPIYHLLREERKE